MAGCLVSSDVLHALHYDEHRLLMAAIYTTSAIISFAISHRLKNKLYTHLLISCMLVSSLFNIVMMSPDMYYLLVDIKQNNAISWKTIYLSIEIAIALIIGKSGFDYITNCCCVCCNRFYATIHSNTNRY